VHKIFYGSLIKISLLAVLLLTSACSSVIDARKQKIPIMNAYYSGNVKLAAADLSEKSSDREGSGDELMWLLEAGTSHFSAGEYKKSLHFFVKAERLIASFDRRAIFNARAAGSEVGSALTNPNALPYQGMSVDRVMLNAYKALNYLAMNQPDSAQVELRRMREIQKRLVQKFHDEIGTRQKEINAQVLKNQQKSQRFGSKNTQIPFSKIVRNPKVRDAYSSSAKKANPLYANLANPFVSYFSALGYLMENNYAEALVDFRNLYQMNPNNALIQKDYVSVARKIGSRVPNELRGVKSHPYSLNKKVVYFVLFNGRAPALKQEKFQIVLPYVGYTGIAFPKYEYFPPLLKGLDLSYRVNQKYESIRTKQVSDFDAIMSQEYHARLPTMITRLVISTLTKEIASYAVVQASKKIGGTYGNIGALLLTGAYKLMFNQADTRGWETLPKEVQIAHLPIPDKGVIKITSVGGGVNSHHKITIKPDTNMAIVFVRGLSASKLIYKLIEW
jgi:hypothetical protein